MYLSESRHDPLMGQSLSRIFTCAKMRSARLPGSRRRRGGGARCGRVSDRLIAASETPAKNPGHRTPASLKWRSDMIWSFVSGSRLSKWLDGDARHRDRREEGTWRHSVAPARGVNRNGPSGLLRFRPRRASLRQLGHLGLRVRVRIHLDVEYGREVGALDDLACPLGARA
jgi:hypothetical protein